MITLMYRTECNYGSKYFTDIAKAYRHFHKCVALGDSVELWAVGKGMQILIDFVDFQPQGVRACGTGCAACACGNAQTRPAS